MAQTDSKIKQLRASLGDYDSQDIEHHKVLKIIFSLIKKLLRLPGDEAAKEFIQVYSSKLDSANTLHHKYKTADSSSNSGNEQHAQDDASDYFPNYGQQAQSIKSPFSPPSKPTQGRASAESPFLDKEDFKPPNIKVKSTFQQKADVMNQSLDSGNKSPRSRYTPSKHSIKSYASPSKDYNHKHNTRQNNLSMSNNGAQIIQPFSVHSSQASRLSPRQPDSESQKEQKQQIELLTKLVSKLQTQVSDNQNKIMSFEKFLNYSNPMGASYVLKPQRSEVHLPVNFDKLPHVPRAIRKLQESLKPFNYSPIPFSEFHKRTFVPISKTQNGDYYEGQWSESTGRRDGFGYCVYEDGSLYEGYWRDGTQHGHGRIILFNGYYEGEFSTNQRQGQGSYYFNSGDFYQGEWMHSQKNGYGKMYSKVDDTFYEGQFKNNKKHGEGKILAADGIKVLLRGTWINDNKQ